MFHAQTNISTFIKNYVKWEESFISSVWVEITCLTYVFEWRFEDLISQLVSGATAFRRMVAHVFKDRWCTVKVHETQTLLSEERHRLPSKTDILTLFLSLKFTPTCKNKWLEF